MYCSGPASRVDTSLLPANLPRKPAKVPDVFEGPAAAVRPGALGETLAGDSLKAAAVGEKARLAANGP